MGAVTFDELLEGWIAERPDLHERFARESGFISPEVFEAERRKAEAERRKAEAEAEARRKAEAERQKAEAEAETERRMTIQKLNKRGLTDMEIAEFMELDMKTIQTYIATGV